MTTAISERREAGKRYQIDVRGVVENHNPRNPLSQKMQSEGYTLFTGEGKDLWQMALADPSGYCRAFEENDPEFQTWATTLLTVGQVQPVELRDNGSKKGATTYTLISGCRRCLAVLYNWCKQGQKGTPWVQAQLAPKLNATGLYHRSIVENTQRPPNAMERARAIQTLTNQGLKVREIAETYGSSESWVREKLKLLELPLEVQRKIEQGKLRPSKALAAHQEANKGDSHKSNGKARKAKAPKLPEAVRTTLEPFLDIKEKDGNNYYTLTIHRDEMEALYKLLGKKLD